MKPSIYCRKKTRQESRSYWNVCLTKNWHIGRRLLHRVFIQSGILPPFKLRIVWLRQLHQPVCLPLHRYNVPLYPHLPGTCYTAGVLLASNSLFCLHCVFFLPSPHFLTSLHCCVANDFELKRLKMDLSTVISCSKKKATLWCHYFIITWYLLNLSWRYWHVWFGAGNWMRHLAIGVVGLALQLCMMIEGGRIHWQPLHPQSHTGLKIKGMVIHFHIDLLAM